MHSQAKTMETSNSESSLPEQDSESNVLKFKERMLKWANPVEFVNNMYGCHPDDKSNDYFKTIFAE